jgi:hypothetical protein
MARRYCVRELLDGSATTNPLNGSRRRQLRAYQQIHPGGPAFPEQRNDPQSDLYTYNAAPFTVTPYFQFTHVPAASSLGAFTGASTYGGAILANYSFGDDTPFPGFSVPLRFEYIAARSLMARPICSTAPAAMRGR